MKRIGVYGGTFDPIHLGHMAAARAAAKALKLDKLLLVPAGDPPHKLRDPNGADGAHRLEMTRIAADRMQLDVPVKVSSLELQRGGKSYTSDTLRVLHEKHPKAELILLMGSDMFLTLHQWHEPEVICALSRICAFHREKDGLQDAFAVQKTALERMYCAKVDIIPIPEVIEISSTDIRAQLQNGSRPSALEESVYGYILRNGLYGTHADLKALDWTALRACSYSMIQARRIPHVRGVEETAVRLAKRWGADENAARAAAILHDCTKYDTLQEQLSWSEKYGIMLDGLERTSDKLMHSKTGAAIAQAEYGMPFDVVEAIRWHTTGKAGMNLLEKILYIADYMEPTRDFDGVERLRNLVETDLDAAVMLGLEMSIEDLTQRNIPVHPNTSEALRYLRKEYEND